MLFFFFFQAEDGIRDKLVTGVQTCALPIYAVDRNALPRPDPNQHAGVHLPHRAAGLRPAVDHGGALAFRRQKRFEVARRPGAASRLQITAYGEQHQYHGGCIEVDMRASLDDCKSRINVGGTDADNDERRGPQAPLNAIEPGLAKKWSAEND